ncbi:MAG: HNH endonuclease [Nanoarchaeota archaeon]|nr:HNH endonuclease [Nanoarchaeota archaeon]
MNLNINQELMDVLGLDELRLKWLISQSKNNELNQRKKFDREKVFNKLGRKCQICGFSELIEIHHINPVSKDGNDNLDNLVILCPNHHGMTHIDRFRDKIQERLNNGK